MGCSNITSTKTITRYLGTWYVRPSPANDQRAKGLRGISRSCTYDNTITAVNIKYQHLLIIAILQGASLSVRLPPPATLAYKFKEELNEMRMNEADREVHDFRCKLATWKMPLALHGLRKQPGTWTKYEYEQRRRRERSSVQANPSLIAPAELLCERLNILVGRADFVSSFILRARRAV